MTKEELESEIEKRKRILVREARDNGLHENYGRKDVRELESWKFEVDSYQETRRMTRMLEDFSDWCGSFDMGDLRNKSNKEIVNQQPVTPPGRGDYLKESDLS